jgi:hypothetical protein
VTETPADQGDERADAHGSAVRIVRGDATPLEVATVTAVLTAALEELADDNAHVETSGPSAWQRSQRNVRSTLQPGHGAWRGFSA